MASQLDLFFVGVSSSTVSVGRLLEVAATDDDAAFFLGEGGGAGVLSGGNFAGFLDYYEPYDPDAENPWAALQ